MQFVESKTVPEHVPVYQNTLEIPMRVVDRNVFLIPIALRTKLAFEASVKILVLALVVKMQIVKSLTTFRPVHVVQDIPEIHSASVMYSKIPVRILFIVHFV